nr:MAG TPA: hypothetical protein [Bacteriophage sp.]
MWFPISSAYIFFHVGSRALLEELYLFILYALRCLPALRNLKDYLGINIFLQRSLYRFCPIII